jgi:hypothetical protein
MHDKARRAKDRYEVGGRDYEAAHLAKLLGISVEQVRELIERFGDDQEALYPKPLNSSSCTNDILRGARQA